MGRRVLAGLVVVGMLFLGAVSGVAATLNVPSDDYPTIQSAIDAAGDGDQYGTDDRFQSPSPECRGCGRLHGRSDHCPGIELRRFLQPSAE